MGSARATSNTSIPINEGYHADRYGAIGSDPPRQAVKEHLDEEKDMIHQIRGP